MILHHLHISLAGEYSVAPTEGSWDALWSTPGGNYLPQ